MADVTRRAALAAPVAALAAAAGIAGSSGALAASTTSPSLATGTDADALRALHLQAFAALTTSPGARAYYDTRRNDGHTHHQALRAVSNRLVGILHGCLRHGTPYDEATAWPRYTQKDQAAA